MPSKNLQRLIRGPAAAEILCLVLVALVLAWSRPGSFAVRPLLALMAVFAAAVVIFRIRAVFPHPTPVKLAIESWTMMLFITGVLWFTGKTTSPLFNLYLLPIVLSALTLGRVLTLVQVAAVCACHVFLSAATVEFDLFSLSYASRVAGEVVPFFLVGYLTTTLSADVTEAREHLKNLAQTDALTGLLNMKAFNAVLQHQHGKIELDKGIYALLMIDIDKLKAINEAYGHDAGNSAIVLVAQCIQRCIRTSDFAARLSADEFIVFLPLANPEIAEAVVKRIRNNVYSTTLDLRSRMIRCTVSIGVVSYPKDGRDTRELTSLADRRMRRDKELRRPPPAV